MDAPGLNPAVATSEPIRREHLGEDLRDGVCGEHDRIDRDWACLPRVGSCRCSYPATTTTRSGRCDWASSDDRVAKIDASSLYAGTKTVTVTGPIGLNRGSAVCTAAEEFDRGLPESG